MKLLELEEKIKKWYALVAFLILIALAYFGFESAQKLFQISLVFIVIPILLLTVYAITGIKKSVRFQYNYYRNELSQKIKKLRKKQDKIRDWKKLAELDEEILSLRQEEGEFQDDRFIKLIFYSLIWFGITALLFLFDLEKVIDIQNWVIMYISFAIGIYHLAKASVDLIRGL